MKTPCALVRNDVVTKSNHVSFLRNEQRPLTLGNSLGSGYGEMLRRVVRRLRSIFGHVLPVSLNVYEMYAEIFQSLVRIGLHKSVRRIARAFAPSAWVKRWKGVHSEHGSEARVAVGISGMQGVHCKGEYVVQHRNKQERSNGGGEL